MPKAEGRGSEHRNGQDCADDKPEIRQHSSLVPRLALLNRDQALAGGHGIAP